MNDHGPEYHREKQLLISCMAYTITLIKKKSKMLGPHRLMQIEPLEMQDADDAAVGLSFLAMAAGATMLRSINSTRPDQPARQDSPLLDCTGAPCAWQFLRASNIFDA
jgi:hypothetical protein